MKGTASLSRMEETFHDLKQWFGQEIFHKFMDANKFDSFFIQDWELGAEISWRVQYSLVVLESNGTPEMPTTVIWALAFCALSARNNSLM
jgi:hypothetical protein